MDWFRLYLEARTDKKLQTLTDRQFRIWFNLLCFSAEQDERGAVPYDDLDVLAVEVADCDTDQLTETLERLVKLKIVRMTGDTIAFINFEKRQYDHPSDMPERVAERVRRHRERKRSNASNDTVTSGNTLDTDTDTDTELRDTDKRESTKTRSRKKPITDLPDDFLVTDEMRAWARNRHKLSDQQIDERTEHFLNYVEKTGKQYASWPAAWRDSMTWEPRTNGAAAPASNERPRRNGRSGYTLEELKRMERGETVRALEG